VSAVSNIYSPEQVEFLGMFVFSYTVSNMAELVGYICENGMIETFLHKCDLFTKTGSAQT
jgi:hypothetical protein